MKKVLALAGLLVFGSMAFGAGAEAVDRKEANIDADVRYDCDRARVDFDYQELIPLSDKIVYIFLDANGDGVYPANPVAVFNFDNDGQNDSKENFWVQTFDLPADLHVKAVMFDEGAVENNAPPPGADPELVRVVTIDRANTCVAPTSVPPTPVPPTPVPPTPIVVEVPVFVPAPAPVQVLAPAAPPQIITQNQSVTVEQPVREVVREVVRTVPATTSTGIIKAPNAGDGGLLK